MSQNTTINLLFTYVACFMLLFKVAQRHAYIYQPHVHSLTENLHHDLVVRTLLYQLEAAVSDCATHFVISPNSHLAYIDSRGGNC